MIIAKKRSKSQQIAFLSFLKLMILSQQENEFSVSFIDFKYKLLRIMKTKSEKMRGEYFIDSKQITAKKAKRNNESFTPNSLSTSHNHHKYEKYDEIVHTDVNSQTITIKQFNNFIRCLKRYCKNIKKTSSQSLLKKGEIAEKLYCCLRQKYAIVGDPIKISTLEASLRQCLPEHPRACEKCAEAHNKCNEFQEQYLRQVLPADVQDLEKQLQAIIKQNQLCSDILEEKRNSSNQQSIIQELKEIVRSQEEAIRQLEGIETKQQSSVQKNWKRQKLNLEIFIEETDDKF